MDFFRQLKFRRGQTGKKLDQLASLSGMQATHISSTLSGARDARASTLAALADAMDAEWVLVPKHLLLDVERLLSGRDLAPDNAPSTMDQLFGSDHE